MKQDNSGGNGLSKAMILFATVLVFLVLLFFGTPFIAPTGVVSAASEPQEFTVGNSTFIPLPVDYAGNFAQKKLAMETVQKFEKAHPELIVSCWNPTYVVGSMNVAIDGVSIFHRHK